MMPTFLGEPFYPAGFPLRTEDITINSEKLDEIKFRYYEGKQSLDDEEVLKEYVLYYIGAPVFNIEYQTEETRKNLKSMPLDEMLNVLLEKGLDPL